jgi:hypothetical protein
LTAHALAAQCAPVRILLAVLFVTACIERPFEESAQPARPVADRASLKEFMQPPPADITPVGANFANAAELVGYKLEPPQLVPGQRSKLTLYWKCTAPLEPWHIFVHLDSAQGGERIHAEHDPVGGRFPTDQWKPGDYIDDSFYFVPGQNPLLLFLGFYSQGDQRLLLTSPGKGRDDGSNRLLAGALPLAH